MALTGKGLGPLDMKQRALPYTSISSKNVTIIKNIVILLIT